MSTKKTQSKRRRTNTFLSSEEMIQLLISEGYTVYAWKEGYEGMPKGLQHYIEALSDKKAQETIEQYNEANKRTGNNDQNLSCNRMQPGGPTDIMEEASKIVMALRAFKPNEQNKVLGIATDLMVGIRDGHIKELRRQKEYMDRSMKDINDQLSEYANSLDELIELKK